MKLDLYTQAGEKKGQIEASKKIFEAKINNDLMHQALVMQHANRRNPYAHTLTKGEVRGGGRKPYSQKSTGNARQGSTRNPQWKGGGVSFGPRKERNYTVMMPKKQRRAALFSALSLKAQNNEIFALESYESKDAKTKLFAAMISKLPVEKDVLIVIPEKNEMVQKSSKNIPYVKTILVNYLNIADLQKYNKVMFLKEALSEIEKVFSDKPKSTK
jgi:large subunit ribosomal protein L4